MSTPDHSQYVNEVFARGGWTLSTHDGAGQFCEAVVLRLHEVDPEWGHLKKTGAQNQYNGHAVDAALYRATGNTADFIGSAGDPDAHPSWGINQEDHYPPDLWFAPAGTAPVDPQQPAPAGDLTSQVQSFLPAAARSLDVLHVEQRLVGVALGCMDDQGNPTYVSELQVIKNQLGKLVDRPPADSPTTNITPEMVAAFMPLVTQIVSDVAAEWIKKNPFARITVTPLKK